MESELNQILGPWNTDLGSLALGCIPRAALEPSPSLRSGLGSKAALGMQPLAKDPRALFRKRSYQVLGQIPLEASAKGGNNGAALPVSTRLNLKPLLSL